MATFVALLRGANVGKAKRVPMADLRDLLCRLGYGGVATLLNSGNAVFRAARGTPARHAADVAAAISEGLRVEVPVIVISAKDLTGIVAENPFTDVAANPARLLIAFVQDAKSLLTLAAIGPLVVAPEQFEIGSRAAYLLCANGIHGSKAGEALLGRVGKVATTRNWTTVLKLHAVTSGHGT